MNKVFLVGRLASDPEPFTTKSGISQSRLTIATQDNSNKQDAYFFPCVAWRNQANFINTYLKKGDLVAVDGKLVRRSFINKEGKNIFVTEIVIDAINSLGSKKDSNSGLSFNAKPTKQSIDDAFPENVVKQTSGNQEHKPEQVKHDIQEDVEWLDEIDKE